VNVLLVNPPFGGRTDLPPLGLLSLAGALLREGVPVEILDLDLRAPADPAARLDEALERLQPAVVGVTAMSDSFFAALAVCAGVRSRMPRSLTVLGGIHATILHDRILQEHGEVDIVVRGEGETALCEILRERAAGRTLDGVAGVSFRQDGKVVCNGPREPGNLDDVPDPAHHLIDGGRYWARVIASSRGCPRRCTFCSIRSLYGGTVRYRHPERVIEEIRGLGSAGARRIFFSDDNFTADPRRVSALCRRIVGEGFHRRIRFFAEGRIDDICDNPMLPGILADAGFGALYLGAESGSQDILDYYRKGITPSDVERCVSLCVEQNLTPVVSFILYGPRDTAATMRETLALARRIFENGAEIAYTEMLIPYPGTPIQARLQQEGKFRQKGGAYYFESYCGLVTDEVLGLFSLARRTAALLYRNEPFAQDRRVYREFGFLDELLAGKVPEGLVEFLAGLVEGSPGRREAERLHSEILRLIGPDGQTRPGGLTTVPEPKTQNS